MANRTVMILQNLAQSEMGILENKDRARLFYKYLSTVYDRVNPFFWTEEMRTDALDLLDVDETDRVLDVGCGTGFGTTGLLERTETVHGLDQSVHQMEKAWEKFGKHDPVRFYRGDAENLPFADGAFDHVWSSGSIEYWPHPEQALAELKRVTKPGGRVLVVGPNYPKNSLKARVADAIMLFYGEDEADRMFADAGFAEWDHHIMGPPRNTDVAITTIARVPADSDLTATASQRIAETD